MPTCLTAGLKSQIGQMGYEPAADVQEGEPVRGSDSETGGYRFRLVPSGPRMELNVPEAGPVLYGLRGL